MTEPRLNGAIAAIEEGRVLIGRFAAPEVSEALRVSEGYDVVVFDLEHNPFDMRSVRDGLQYLLDRRQIVTGGTLAPAVTPLVRIPASGAEMTRWMAHQALDLGAYGVVWPHVSSVEAARNAVSACRYRGGVDGSQVPAGNRGDGPFAAARYWGVSVDEYYRRAGVWPVDTDGEILVVIMCEEMEGVRNLPEILAEVKGIGAVLIGEGDLCQDLGHPREYGHPDVETAIDEVRSICKHAGVACGIPHVTRENVRTRLAQEFDWLMTSTEHLDSALELVRVENQGRDV